MMSSRTAPGCEFNNACTRNRCASMALPNLVAHFFLLCPLGVLGFSGRLHPQQRHRRREHLRREGQVTRCAAAQSHARAIDAQFVAVWAMLSVLEFDLGLTRAFSAVRFLFRCQFPDENFRLKHAGQLEMRCARASPLESSASRTGLLRAESSLFFFLSPCPRERSSPFLRSRSAVDGQRWSVGDACAITQDVLVYFPCGHFYLARIFSELRAQF